MDPDGRAISDALVCITMVTTSLSSYGYTNPDGTFSCIVPAETPITISVKNTCGTIIKTVELVVEGENYDLGEIAVDLSINLVTITGNLICDGIPVTEGYAHLVLSNGTQYAANTDENGAFEIQLTGCGNNIKYTFRGYDHSNGNASIAEVITTTDTELDFSNTQVCTELPEFIIYKINDELRTITDPSARFLNGKLLFEGQLPLVESGFDASVENPTVGQHIPEFLSAYIFDSSTSISVACDEATSCADFLIDITEIGTVGDLVRGTFSALNDSVSLTGSFKTIIDSDDTAGSISGNVWTDADGDGERADNEYYNGERFDINLLDNSGTLVRTTTAIWTMESFQYFFNNVNVGSYIVEPVIPVGFDLLDLNSTSDEARDNDIDPTTGRSESITIDLDNLEEVVDIGFVKNEELNCRVEILSYPNCWNVEQGQVIFYPPTSDSLFSTLSVTGPVVLPDLPLTEPTSLTLIPGFYTWEIVTADGRSCSGDFDLTVMAELPCEFGYEATECLSGLVDFIIYFDCGPNVLINMGVEDLQWEWEDGSSEPYLLGVSPGMYQYTITADNDCTTTGVMDLHPYNGLSGSVWVENAFLNDGIKDPGEDYLYDYPVNLYRASDPSTIYMTDNTSADGIYSFTKLPIGDYLISVELEDGYEFTDYRVVGSTTSNDNDVNPVDGFSDSYSIIDGCEFYNQVDIGIREK